MARTDSFWSDIETLKVLVLSEIDGLPASAIGKRFGVSRSAILGLLNRVRSDLRSAELLGFAEGEGPAQKPENRDGGMPARWWDISGRAPT